MLQNVRQQGLLFRRFNQQTQKEPGYQKFFLQLQQLWDELYGKKSSWDTAQKLRQSLTAAALLLFFSYFFYRSLLALPLLFPIAAGYLRMSQRENRDRQKRALRTEFKDAILSLSANLKAGYAVENALRETGREMDTLYGSKAQITRYLQQIVRGLCNNLPVEQLMQQFAAETGLEEIREFADIFSIVKKSGGNLTEIITETAEVISEKIETEKEIQVMITAKQLELRIMNLVPFAIVFYISVTSQGFFDVLYHNIPGVLIMTGCLILYLAAWLLGRRLIRIEV